MDTENNSTMSPKTKITLVVLIVSLIVTSCAAYYFYGQYSALKKSIEAQNNPLTSTVTPKTPQEEINQVVASVGRHIILPQEQATVATVTDADLLRGQPFFRNAKTGDKVVIFPVAKIAILYDPIADKIVQIGPFSVQGLTGNLAPNATSTLKK